MGCEHLDDFYELYLLGTVDGGACAEIREHLARGCPACFTRLREGALTVYLLSQDTRRARPDPKQKSQLLRRLRKRM